MADNTNRVAGVASLTIGGRNVLLKGDLYYKVSGSVREPKNGQDGYHGYKEMPVSGEIGGTLRDWAGISVFDLGQVTNETILATLANGKTVAGRGMTCQEPPRTNTEEAEIEIVFFGPDVKEV